MKHNGKKWILTFEDTFEGTALDGTKWKKCPEMRRQDAGGRWSDAMTALDGEGHLVLSASLAEDGTPISGAVRSMGLFEQAYGYFECRLKFQHTTGFWGAFWLMCGGAGRYSENMARDGAEIDVIESGEFPRGGVNHAIHWNGYGEHHQSVSKIITAPELYEGFHTYALEWTKSEYIFYIDGKETWRTDEPGICTVPVYLKLSCEFGTWAGEIKKETLPDCMVVDYVRVYRQVEEA